MSKTMPSMNDLVSLTVMLLMIIALVAAQANAADYQTAVSAITETAGPGYEEPVLPLNARLQSQLDAAALTISIEATADVWQLLIDDK